VGHSTHFSGEVVATSDDGYEVAVVFDHIPNAAVPVPVHQVKVTARNPDDDVDIGQCIQDIRRCDRIIPVGMGGYGWVALPQLGNTHTAQPTKPHRNCAQVDIRGTEAHFRPMEVDADSLRRRARREEGVAYCAALHSANVRGIQLG
jgi:hypothetical protein